MLDMSIERSDIAQSEGELLPSVTESLRVIYEKYAGEGLKAVYLWGSVTTTDFDIRTSDVDGIGVVGDQTDIALEEKIKYELEAQHPEVVKFGFRLVHESELSGKMKPVSPLASVILPRLLLLDMPHWTYVAGEKYEVSDFTDNPPTPAEGLYWRLEQMKNKGWADIRDVEKGKEQRVSKILWRIVYLFELMSGDKGSFSYSAVCQNAGEEMTPYVHALNELKSSGYDRAVFEKDLPLFEDLVEKAKQFSESIQREIQK